MVNFKRSQRATFHAYRKHIPTVSLMALAATLGVAPAPTFAADAQPAQSGLDEIIVTGSRIVRDGYEAPTPLTVVDATALSTAATSNVAEQLSLMPVFSGSLSPASAVSVPSQGTGGISSLNLRSLGLPRTLILLDGQRFVSTLSNGVVDIDNFPQQLIQRVDVVTGGASAIYGSDAVAGVVNVILDKEFVGVKGEVSGGVTTYGDDANWKISLASGFTFGGGRGHVVMSGETTSKDGIAGVGDRKWGLGATGMITNPAYGTGAGQSTSVPQYIRYDNVGLSQGTHGGIIFSGPLKGIAFGEHGVPYQFNYGITTPNDLYMAGGDYAATLNYTTRNLDPEEVRHNVFLRGSYDVTDSINVFGEALYGFTATSGLSLEHYEVGSGPTVLSGNPFIPASVQAQMTALGLASFRIGTTNYDMLPLLVQTARATNRYVFGANGKFDAMDTAWKWDASVEIATTRTAFNTGNNENKARYALALDAVRDPATGSIVCRSTLTAPNNGCVPWNPMGTNVNDDLAKNYLLGTAHGNMHTGQKALAASVTGEPFSDWAGPVSLALSLEHRQDLARVTSGPIEQAGLWRSGNLQPVSASVSVTEGAAETVIPLAKKAVFADSWDLSAAFRGTSYQTSGYVSTWKLGTTYAPVSDIRLRATRSRDIRAPNISELYQNQDTGLGTSLDPLTNTSPTYGRLQTGNINLKPEKADTTDIGLVFQPTFLPGFSTSVDYWNVNVKGAITVVSAANTIIQCYQGQTQFCPGVIRTNGVVTRVIFSAANFASQVARGIDFEASYNFSLSSLFADAPGEIRIHSQGTKYLKNLTNDGITLPNDIAGTANLPKWIVATNIAYTLDNLSTSLTARYFSGGVLDNDYITCTSGCPVSTTDRATFDNQSQPGAFYLDAAIEYKFVVADTDMSAFLNVKNLLNKDPALVYRRGGADFDYTFTRSEGGRYDKLGRVFRAGVKFKL